MNPMGNHPFHASLGKDTLTGLAMFQNIQNIPLSKEIMLPLSFNSKSLALP